MTRKAVITGIGVVLPETQTLDELWRYQLNGDDYIRPLSDRISGSVVDESAIAHRLAPRLSNKLDSFTRYALVATQYAIEDAGLDMTNLDRERCGVFVGNAFGGWRFTETELRNLHCHGPRAVSPFQATSWFPAAPQGQISIFHGIKGFSKTYMADRASSLLSVASAANQIKSGKLDVAIAGGTESINTDFVITALEQVLPYSDAPPHYTPFGRESDGFALSEGAVFLILEERERAIQRGAEIYAQLEDFAMRNVPCESDRYGTDAGALIQSMKDACGGRKPDLVMPDACGLNLADHAEATALQEVCSQAPLVIPKQKYGHSFGAEGALDIAYACLMLRNQQIFPSHIKTLASPLKADRFCKELRNVKLDSILINSCASGGASGSLFLTSGAA